MASSAVKMSIRSGAYSAQAFGAAGTPHTDWQTFHIPFDPWFPPGANAIRVLVSASDDGVSPTLT